jgi:hypothetical protein
MNAAGEITLKDLMLELALRMGWQKHGSGTDNTPQLPDDANLLFRLKNSINNGRREVMRRMPTAWCFRPRVTITLDPAGTGAQCVDGDPSKYRLPRNAAGLADGEWTWSLTAGYGGPLQQRHASDLAYMHASTSTNSLTSRPAVMALAMATLNNPAEPGRQTCPFLWVYPPPDDAYTISGTLRLVYTPLAGLDDVDPMGDLHAETLVTAGERDLKINHPDLQHRALMEQMLQAAVERSIETDNQNRPQQLGIGHDPDATRQAGRGATAWPDQAAMVTTVNGVSVI